MEAPKCKSCGERHWHPPCPTKSSSGGVESRHASEPLPSLRRKPSVPSKAVLKAGVASSPLEAKVNDRDNRSGARKAPKSPGRPADSRDVGAVDGKDKPSSAGTLNRSELARRTLPRRRESMPDNVESRDQGRVDPSPPPKPKRKAAAFNKIAAGLTVALAFAKGESTGAVVHKTKTGRHLVEDRDKTIESQKPWIAAGMCRATWYSRRKAKRGEQ